MANAAQRWCTKHNVSNPASDPGARDWDDCAKQCFAQLWFDLLFKSEYLLNFVKGQQLTDSGRKAAQSSL